MELSDKQWDLIKDLLPDGQRRADGRGRPWQDKRAVLEGIFWVLRTGAPWKALPERYPRYQTCQRRLQIWQQLGIFEQLMEALARDLQDTGGIDLSECFPDGIFSMAKEGQLIPGYWMAKLNALKTPGSWQSQTLRLLFYLSQCTSPAILKVL